LIPGSPTYIDKIDFSYKATTTRTFPAARLCIAENVQNQSVQLRDSAGSFIGPATGTYYRANSTQTQQGGEIFKFSDESLATVIATGSVITSPGGMALVRDVVRFDLRVALKGQEVGLIFQNITRAQQDTGVASNTGFGPVGTWTGARAPDIYAALEALASKVKACIGE
jgi:hypothetical protein